MLVKGICVHIFKKIGLQICILKYVGLAMYSILGTVIFSGTLKELIVKPKGL